MSKDKKSLEYSEQDPSHLDDHSAIDPPHVAEVEVMNHVIQFAVKILAFLMVLVIFWGIGDVFYVLYQRLMAPPFMLLKINDILATFGAFLAVLIAIEIYINIRMYLSSAAIPVRLVVATALMAISRKVIIFDFSELQPEYIYGVAAVIMSLGITYWLITKKTA